MGYESYLVDICIKKDMKKLFIDDLIAKEFKVLKSCGNIYLEKEYETGIIEVFASHESIMFRYAKPNLQESLAEFLKLLKELSKKYNFTLFDYYSKNKYEPKDFLKIAETYEKTHKEFLNYYPNKRYPVKSEDVFNE